MLSLIHISSREQADFLKREYGTGGRSHAVSGASHSEESFDGKGIRWRKQDVYKRQPRGCMKSAF